MNTKFYELYEKIEESKEIYQEIKKLEEEAKEKEKEMNKINEKIKEIIKEEIKEYKKYVLYIDINPKHGHTYHSTIGELKKDVRISVSDKAYEILGKIHETFFIGEGSVIAQTLAYVDENTKTEYSIEFRLEFRCR